METSHTSGYAGQTMLVRDWMSARVVSVTPRTSVMEARRLLRRHGIRHLPVVDDGRLVGMLSDRDLHEPDTEMGQALRSLGSDLASGRYRRVESLMTSPVLTAFPSDHVLEAASLMLTRRIGALPVVEDGQLVGIIAIGDCVRALGQAVARERTTRAFASSTAGSPPAGSPVVEGPLPLRLPMPPGDERPGRSEVVTSALRAQAPADPQRELR